MESAPDIEMHEHAATPYHRARRAALQGRFVRMSLIAGFVGSLAGGAVAQQFPGLVLTQPTPPPAAAPPPAKAKPKAKPQSHAKETSAEPSRGGGERIVMLVNDEAVTAREIEQRSRFLAASTGGDGQKAREIFNQMAKSEAVNAKFRAMAEGIIKQNQGKSREQIMALIDKGKGEFAQSLQRQAIEQARSSDIPKHRKAAIEEIIEEKLKLQEAKREGIEISDDEVNRVIKGIAERNKQTEAQFAQNLKSTGVDISTMRARFRAGFAWREVVRRKYGMQVQVNEREIEQALAAHPAAKGQADTQELQLQRIVFALPGKLDQGAMARALADADSLRRKYSGCKTMDGLAKGLSEAKFEPAQYVKPSTIGEPARSMLMGAKDGEMLPPQTSPQGVELMVVCSRRGLQIDDKQRQDATQELQSKKFEEFAVRRLRELRQNAQIENRG